MALFLQKVKMMIMAALIMSELILVAKSTPNTTVTLFRCNANQFSQNDPYAKSVSYVLAHLMNLTPNHGYSYYTHSPHAEAVCYGHARCNRALSYKDCSDCLIVARADIISASACRNTTGSTLNMVDCSIRYENYSF